MQLNCRKERFGYICSWFRTVTGTEVLLHLGEPSSQILKNKPLTFSLSSIKSDYLGAVSSTLCLIHCVATPFIFIAHSALHHDHAHDHAHGHGAPIWWQAIDIIFLAIAFLAVYQSAKNTSKNWVRYGLWISWALLVLFIINEKFHWAHLAEFWVFFPSLSLVGLHIYNLKYCQCEDEDCCVTQAQS